MYTGQQIRIPAALWGEITRTADRLCPSALPWPPLVFALYGSEDDHFEIIDYRRIETVKSRGQDDYYYPGVKKLGFYPPKGTGKWFSGTLVVGDGLELDDDDRRWMIRDQMDFRIKMHRVLADDPWQHRVYILEVLEASLDISPGR